jgi:hypothetical protein
MKKVLYYCYALVLLIPITLVAFYYAQGDLILYNYNGIAIPHIPFISDFFPRFHIGNMIYSDEVVQHAVKLVRQLETFLIDHPMHNYKAKEIKLIWSVWQLDFDVESLNITDPDFKEFLYDYNTLCIIIRYYFGVNGLRRADFAEYYYQYYFFSKYPLFLLVDVDI